MLDLAGNLERRSQVGQPFAQDSIRGQGTAAKQASERLPFAPLDAVGQAQRFFQVRMAGGQ